MQIPVDDCQLEQPPDCFCAGHLQAPVCAGNEWSCPICVAPSHDGSVADTRPEKPSLPDATTTPPDADGENDARDGGGGGCGDDAALVCRWGCGEDVYERRPTCDGTTWKCRWNGSLEERSTPPRRCDDRR